MTRTRVIECLGWFGFIALLTLATAPAWRLWVFGFNPTLDEVLQLALCGGPIR